MIEIIVQLWRGLIWFGESISSVILHLQSHPPHSFKGLLAGRRAGRHIRKTERNENIDESQASVKRHVSICLIADFPFCDQTTDSLVLIALAQNINFIYKWNYKLRESFHKLLTSCWQLWLLHLTIAILFLLITLLYLKIVSVFYFLNCNFISHDCDFNFQNCQNCNRLYKF